MAHCGGTAGKCTHPSDQQAVLLSPWQRQNLLPAMAGFFTAAPAGAEPYGKTTVTEAYAPTETQTTGRNDDGNLLGAQCG